MKLRSHEILTAHKKPNPSKFKQLFQRKNILKKKLQSQPTGLIHTIPHYVRKSIFRFLLEIKSPPPPPTARQTPLMGVQALKTKKQPSCSAQPKRSLRLK